MAIACSLGDRYKKLLQKAGERKLEKKTNNPPKKYLRKKMREL
jgi:hypothetical protein